MRRRFHRIYCDERPELANDVVRTREWWDQERADYERFISSVVLDELSEGDYPNKDKCLRLVQGVSSLALASEVINIAEAHTGTKTDAEAACS